MTFLSPREPLSLAQMGASGQYIHTLISWIEIKMAGKLVQMKRDPLTIEEKLWIDKGFYTLQTCVMASHNGKYLIRGSDAKCYLVDGEKLASVDVGEYQATRLVVDRYADVFRGLNIEINHQRGHHAYNNNIPSVIFDLQSRCQCVSTFYKDKQRNEHNYGYWKNYKCNESTVSTPNGATTAFASELDPDLIVFFIAEYDKEKSIYRYVYYPKMVIWKHGKGLQEEKSLPFKNITDFSAITRFSEHIIDNHHWLCFDMGNQTRIIDLNNFNNKFKLDLIPYRLWIPKKNKLILASDKKITVFDLGLNRWTSRMTCQNTVLAMTLNKSARILLVADIEKVHAYHWETGKLVGSVRHMQHHNFPSITTLHIAYDQVLIINGRLFLKMPSKCDM